MSEVVELDRERPAVKKPNGNRKGFLSLDHDFIRSDRVVGLSANGKALILAMADRYNGRNNGAIPYSVKEATVWLRCGRSTACKTFRELQDAKLIECVKKGSFVHKSGARKGTATEWRLTFLK